METQGAAAPVAADGEVAFHWGPDDRKTYPGSEEREREPVDVCIKQQKVVQWSCSDNEISCLFRPYIIENFQSRLKIFNPRLKKFQSQIEKISIPD